MIGQKTVVKPNSTYSDFVRKWFAQLDRGIEKRKKEEPRWEANERFEDMKQWWGNGDMEVEGFYEGEYDQPTINKIGSSIRTYISAVAYKMPRAKITPSTAAGWEPVLVPVMGPDDQPLMDEQGQMVTRPVIKAKAREHLINAIISKPLFGLRAMVYRVVKSACLGYGAAKIGYSPMFETPLEKDTDNELPVDPETGQIDWSGVQMNPVTGMPLEDDKGNLIKKNMTPSWEEWFIDWQHYRHIIIDPDGGNNFMRHRWVAIESIRTLEEVKADPLFKNTKDLRPTGDLRGEDDDYMSPREDEYEDALETVRLFEIYDFVKDRRIVLADGHDKELLNEIMPLGITHDPLAFFRPNERIGKEEEFYPRPIATDGIPLACEKNEMRRLALIGAKRGIRKIIIPKGLLGVEDMDKLTNDEDLEVVEVDVTKTPWGMEKAIHTLQPPNVSMDMWQDMAAADKDYDEVMGISSAARGRYTGSTATETNKVSQYEGTRYDADRNILKEFLVECFKKLGDSIDANMTMERAVELVDEDGQVFQGILDRDMIAGDFETDIDVTEMKPTDDAVDAAQRLQLMQIAGQSPWMFSDEVTARGWFDLFNIKDENFIKKISEVAQMQMQMQAKTDPMSPEAPPPTNSAQAASQTAAGGQTPNMQGAR